MTIHSGHPFLPGDGERDPLRRLRGRMAAPVTVWTSQLDGRPVGWTVSALLLADGRPSELVGLLDADSDLADVVLRTRTVAVSVLSGSHRRLADAFAGLLPAPGGAFRLGSWRDTEWGPVLGDAAGWLGARLAPGEPVQAGWAVLVRATIEHVQLGETGDVLAHLRGRYRTLEL